MPETLLPWYERELDFLRNRVEHFASEHPTLAKRLGVRRDGIDDPHMLRLVDAFALCNARMSRQLAEESTQISNNLLQVLFPLALQPLPSASLIRVRPSPNQAEVATVPYGTRLRMHIDEEQYCQFHTTAELQLCPFDIVASAIIMSPFDLPTRNIPEDSNGAIKLDLQLLDHSRSFDSLASFNDLHIHLQGLLKNHGAIYDYLFKDTIKVILLDDEGRECELSLDNIQPLGFRQEERMLTQQNSTFLDNQVILEMLAWPELFYGFRIEGLSECFSEFSGNKLSLLFFLKNVNESAAHTMEFVQPMLGCAPVINLFEQLGEPVVIDHCQLDYPLIPDSQSPNQIEVQTVERILDITDEEPFIIPSLFGLRHNEPNHHCFWQYHPADHEENDRSRISLVYPELDLQKNQTRVISPLLSCHNGSQVLKLSNDPEIECLDNLNLPGKIQLLSRPTAPAYRSYNIRDRLNLLAHLSKNFSTILLPEDTSASLRSVLELYDFRANPISSAWLNAIKSMYSKPKVACLQIMNHQCYSWGNEVTVTLHEGKLENSSIMLLIHMLDFLAGQLAGFQSFIQLIFQLEGRPGEYYRCSRRHGNQTNR
ncbi:type VI secretion system baseplate subunit TssF [Endozoicomonas sp. OPT23]|uniref:type VI secretion system baseplate subunit TssF n=1 Tax=Endozoicomonas sp. OPT23 TaxID=2072845 RepID=UPI00129ADFC8|nr:type VI secretion system baseplate subunit TssF [Endozoicomonas sp. OPT23]MRI33746.1 type VI secretion system baseplate subunit TssF [Endozoicomonas sp. OPT23]